jgi:hypothetical protein
VLFDLFGFSIAPDLKIIGIEGKLPTRPGHNLSPAHLEYHRLQYAIANKRSSG